MSMIAQTKRTPLPAALENELEEVFGDRFTTAEAMRQQHGEGESFHANEPPDAVVFPESTAEVSAVVRACHRHDVPMIGFGAGTRIRRRFGPRIGWRFGIGSRTGRRFGRRTRIGRLLRTIGRVRRRFASSGTGRDAKRPQDHEDVEEAPSLLRGAGTVGASPMSSGHPRGEVHQNSRIRATEWLSGTVRCPAASGGGATFCSP